MLDKSTTAPADGEDQDEEEETPEEQGHEAPPARVGERRAWLAGAPLSETLQRVLGLGVPMLLTLAGALRVSSFTIDDAYISFRYAENLAHGHGLVYNVGEHVEGYTNFLWTLLLATAVKLGGTPAAASKVLGTSFACAALIPTYLLSRRLRPFSNVPCLATWFLATSFLFTGYAVFGLESPLFILLTLTGTELFLREEEEATTDARPSSASRVPLSGVAFALAALTRPEAPLFLGLLIFWHIEHAFSRRNAVRMILFALPVAAHLLWRHSYYGAWLPNTLSAKTGDLTQQLNGGSDYVRRYAQHAGAFLWLGLASAAAAIVDHRRAGLAIASIALLFGVYVVFVGGDWMPYFRFIAPAEPFAFLLADDALRAIAARRERAASLAIAAFGAITLASRAGELLQAQRNILVKDKDFWDDAAGRTAEWFVQHAEPGPIAIADIGYVGYRTGFPIADMLGLLSPEVSRLPGGYTRKVGTGYTDVMFAKNPRYFVIIATGTDCRNPTVPSSRVSYGDSRFKKAYKLRQAIALKGGAAWCIFEKAPYP
jgi:arabinofuranosyltransferase